MSYPPSSAQDDREWGTWASENLPVSVRKELLERELRKLGFRKAGSDAAGSHASGASQQQQPQGASSHPQADSDGGEHSE